MIELSKRIDELLEEYNFSLCGEITERYSEKGKYDIELETYSPEGEDVIVSLIYDGTEESFIVAFVEYANWFDAEGHAEMWIESRGKNGVPEGIKDLLEDAEWIKNMLLEVAGALNNLDEETEEMNGTDINFTQEELQTLYTACVAYGNDLHSIMKKIIGCDKAVDLLDDMARDCSGLARKIREYMEG